MALSETSFYRNLCDSLVGVAKSKEIKMDVIKQSS